MPDAFFLSAPEKQWIDHWWARFTELLNGSGPITPLYRLDDVIDTGALSITKIQAEQALQAMAQCMGLDPQAVSVLFEAAGSPRRQAEMDERLDALLDEGMLVVSANPEELNSPGAFLSSLPHRLMNNWLHAHHVEWSCEDEGRAQSELAAVFVGAGVITANASLLEGSWSDGLWEGWSAHRRCVLSFEMFGYALTRYVRHRHEDPNAIRKAMRNEVRDAFDRAWAATENQPDIEVDPQAPAPWPFAGYAPGEEPDGDWRALRPTASDVADDPDAPCYCLACGHDVSGLPAGDCPACGQPFDPEDVNSVTLERLTAFDRKSDQFWEAFSRSAKLLIKYGLLLLLILFIIGIAASIF